MKIAVCVDTTFLLQHMDVAHIKQAIQSQDEDLHMVIEPASITALQMAESLAEDVSDITAITYGNLSKRPALTYAKAFGISSLIHLEDDDETLAHPANPQGIAEKISAWLQARDFDLIICGDPNGTALVPSLIAGYLNMPCVSRVYQTNIKEDDVLQLSQQLERGWRQRVTLKLPAVITVQEDCLQTKYVSVRRRRLAYDNMQGLKVDQVENKQLVNITLQSVSAPRTRAKRTAIPDSSASARDRLKSLMGVGGGAPFSVAASSKGAKQEEKGVIDTTPDQAAKEIFDFLEKKELLPEKLTE